LFPTPINTYKYITGTLNKGQPLERGRGRRRIGRGRVKKKGVFRREGRVKVRVKRGTGLGLKRQRGFKVGKGRGDEV
jgi:hypothetical protein